MTTALCSFGTAAYAGALDRLRATAVREGGADAVFLYGEADVAAFFQAHPDHLAPGNRGYGWWAWKPYLILKTFDALADGDTLVYCDACVGVLRPLPTLPPGIDVGLFGLGGHGHTIKKWTHAKALKEMDFWHCPPSAPLVNAGIQVYRVSKESRAFLAEYLDWCCRLEVVADRPDGGGVKGKDPAAFPGFVDHRHDQSVLSVLAQRTALRIALFPDATQYGASPAPLFDHHRKLLALPPKTAVITPTTGGRFLEACMASVQAQTQGNIEHWIVIDGPEFLDGAMRTIKKFERKRPVVVLTLPRNTGAAGWNGHRIYGSVPFLADAETIAYLDDDNVFEPAHLADLAAACERAVPPAAWAHSLRSIVDETGKVLCDDNCESLGGLCHTVNGVGDYLIDTSCYFMTRDLAIAVGPLWNARFRDPAGKPEPDREVAKALLASAPHAVVRKHSVRYRVGNTDRSVRAQFFLEGNAIRNHDFARKKDLYLFHFSEDATAMFFAKSKKPANEVALDEWQPTLWRGLADEYNLINGFDNVPNIPHGATIVAALCNPQALPLEFLAARTDLKRVVYTLESPNIRHADQWTAAFLTKHFDVAMTYWRPLLAAPPPGLKVVYAPHNCHHFLTSSAVPWRANAGEGRSVVMVAERRPFLEGKYAIDSHVLECLDPYREIYARGLSNLTVFGVGWDDALETWPPGLKKPALGHALHRSRDPRPAVDIKAAFVFDLIVENTDAAGYCSEKMYDALLAGCVPLYRGSADRAIVPADCYVDISPFATGAELQTHLDALTDDDVRAYQERIAENRASILEKVGVEAFAACVRRAICA